MHITLNPTRTRCECYRPEFSLESVHIFRCRTCLHPPQVLLCVFCGVQRRSNFPHPLPNLGDSTGCDTRRVHTNTASNAVREILEPTSSSFVLHGRHAGVASLSPRTRPYLTTNCPAPYTHTCIQNVTVANCAYPCHEIHLHCERGPFKARYTLLLRLDAEFSTKPQPGDVGDLANPPSTTTTRI